MKEPTEQIGWIVIILLAIAAIMACTVMERAINENNWFVIILFMALIAICGVLAMRYKGGGEPS